MAKRKTIKRTRATENKNTLVEKKIFSKIVDMRGILFENDEWCVRKRKNSEFMGLATFKTLVEAIHFRDRFYKKELKINPARNEGEAPQNHLRVYDSKIIDSRKEITTPYRYINISKSNKFLRVFVRNVDKGDLFIFGYYTKWPEIKKALIGAIEFRNIKYYNGEPAYLPRDIEYQIKENCEKLMKG